jgi:hypothetical protein
MSQGGIISAYIPPEAQAGDTANVLLTNQLCHTSVYVGSAVYIDSVTFELKNGLADAADTSNILGVVEAKTSSTRCNVRLLGATGSIFVGLDVTKEYYLSDTIAGLVQDTAPTLSGHYMLKLGQPLSTTAFLVLKGQRIRRA